MYCFEFNTLIVTRAVSSTGLPINVDLKKLVLNHHKNKKLADKRRIPLCRVYLVVQA